MGNPEEVTGPDILIEFLDTTFKNPNEKVGTRVQAASSLMQWWFMVETASFLNRAMTQPDQPTEDGV